MGVEGWKRPVESSAEEDYEDRFAEEFRFAASAGNTSSLSTRETDSRAQAPVATDVSKAFADKPKPTMGERVAVGFLCTGLSMAGTVLVTSGYPQGYSTGGLLSWIVGIVCAYIYWSKGKVGPPALGAFIAGMALGLLVLYCVSSAYAYPYV